MLSVRGICRAACCGLLALLCAGWSGARAEAVVAEAEAGRLEGGARVAGSGGVSWVENLTRAGDGVTVDITVPEDGFWDVVLTTDAMGSHKENVLLVDGTPAGSFVSEGSGFAQSRVRHVRLTAGEHSLGVGVSWGWIRVDSLALEPAEPLPEDLYDVAPVLCDPDAMENTRRVMTYLCDIYGNQVLSGQYCDDGMFGMENAAIWRATGGQYPAVLGMDLMRYTPNWAARDEGGSSIDRAIEYWEKQGGLTTLCWHWIAPDSYITGNWYSAFYTDHAKKMDLKKIMEGEDFEGYQALCEGIDAIAAQLARLQEAGVPVLWRPLHEASGGWFWWGAAGPEPYIELYRLIWEKLTVEHGLHNLIWVWNGQNRDWYPGDDVVDIIATDIYAGEHVYTSQAETFLQCVECTPARKLIWLSENGTIPDPEALFADEIKWLGWCTWSGEFVLKSAGFNQLGEKYTEKDMVIRAYKDERVVTRATLPDLRAYPLRDGVN